MFDFLDFAELSEPVDIGAFAAAGFDASETDKIEALLLARPGDQFNYSEQEYQALAQLARTHPSWSLDRHQLDAVNTTPQWRNLATNQRFSPRPARRPQTKFERRGQRLGHGVWDLLATRC